MNAPYLIPAPPVLISVLSYITLSAHLILMNLTLGGSLLVSIYLFKRKEKHLAIAEAMARRLPFMMAFAVVFGAAPMIFVQALYPSLFFRSAVFMSGWFLIIPAAVFASFSLLFFLSARWDALERWRAYLYLCVSAMLGSVLFSFCRLFAVMENLGEKKLVGYDIGGSYFIDPAFLDMIPRFLHSFFASVAVAGLWVAIWGIMKLNREPEQGRWQYRSGATWFSSATIMAIGTGVWRLADIPGDSMMTVLGRDLFSTSLFAALLLSSVCALTFALLGMNSIKPSFFLKIAAVLTIFEIAGMVVLRDILRQAELSGLYDLGAQRAHFQWAAFLIFVLCCTVSLFFCVDLVKKTRSGRKNS
ncbi:MAG TPA: hypothetical protein PK747_02320 [Acidobacteriota bacterium]|nr:hypothetical protein [Acidobacteriota bacterium]HNT16883.1 hypothetical protein [Acidobacteriota bacterium]HQO19596.1 hypothetical protein [Acidobacteriota bacterium]HQQ46229.1 hypothetical protein [Acidobacteriota bacterium]